jgi:hypothetical protein
LSSLGDRVTEPSFLNWLVERYPNAKQLMCYDIDAFMASLCYHLQFTKEEAQQLIETESIYINEFKLTYFPNRFVSIDKGKYHGHPEIAIINASQAGYMETHYNAQETIEQSFDKAKQAGKIGDEIKRVYNDLGMDTNKLVSPISSFLSRYQPKLPVAEDMPDEVNKMAWESAKGGWFQVNSMGHFDAYDYDMNLAYGWALCQIPDFTKGQWVQSKDIPGNAMIGVADGILNTQAQFHPFLVKVKEDNYTPIGKFPITLTLQEIRVLHEYNLGTFNIKDGWWWIPVKPVSYPYGGIVRWLQEKRRGKTGIDKAIISRIYAGCYGKTLANFGTGKKQAFGKEFCPIVGTTVEALTRLKVFKTCMDAGIIPLAILVDGFITDKPITINTGTNMGEWKLSYKGNTLIAGSTAITIEGKTDDTAGELALEYNWLMNAIKDSPKSNVYTKDKYSPVTLAQAYKDDFSKLGQIHKVERAINIGVDDKRVFLKRPKNGQELLDNQYQYDSVPWDYKIISKDLA